MYVSFFLASSVSLDSFSSQIAFSSCSLKFAISAEIVFSFLSLTNDLRAFVVGEQRLF